MTERAHVMNASIECNNAGVSLLIMGLLVEALDAFTVAAQILYPVSQSFYSSLTSEVETDIQQMLPFPVPLHEDDDATAVLKVKAVLAQAEQSAETMTNLAAGNSFMCVDPLMMGTIQGEPTSCCMESAIIVMNMGLAYTLYGAEPCLLKALVLFDLAFAIVQPLADDLRSEWVAMTSINNAAYILHSLGNYEYSAFYLSLLHSYILSLPETSDYLKSKARHRCLLNVMFLREPKNARAA